MKRKLLGSLAALALASAPALAQVRVSTPPRPVSPGIVMPVTMFETSPPPQAGSPAQPLPRPANQPAPTPAPAPTPMPSPAIAPCYEPSSESCLTGESCLEGTPIDKGGRVWIESEYLLWWIRDGNLPFPAVTTSSPDALGILGLGNTTVVRGNERFDYSTFNGARVTIGTWLDDCHEIGVQASGFLLEQRQAGFTVASGTDGTPLVARPFFDTTINLENSRLVALPGGASGQVAIASSSRLWGAEVNGVLRLLEDCTFVLDALVGARYLDLEEDLTIDDRSILFNQTATTAFNGRGVLAPVSTLVQDKFSTRNQFYGGQIGTHIGLRRGRFGLDLTGKLGIGSLHTVVTRDGSTTLVGGGPAPATVPGGLLVLASNAGRFTDDTFAILPEGSVRVSFALTRCVSISGGYSYLYLNRVARPGEQVDRTLNPTLIPTSPTFGQAFGPARPAPLFDRTTFDAHGVSVGLNINF